MSVFPVMSRYPSKRETERDCLDLSIKVLEYLSDPLLGRKDSAEIPLENVFRLTEMYRYDAYDDGPPKGWHVEIVRALDKARTEAFGHDFSKEDVVLAIQQGLRELHPSGFVSDARLAEKMKTFFTVFCASLPMG